MRRRRIPRAQLEIPIVGFGTGDNAGLMVAGEAREQQRAVERSLQLGIDYFDTAPDYGDGRAEENLGRALRSIGEPATICTKVEIKSEDLDGVASAVVRSVDSSLRRLGVERVEIVQIHNAPVSSAVELAGPWGPLELSAFLGEGAAVDGLEKLRAQGKVGAFGFTCAHADPAAVRALVDSGCFEMINVWFNLLNPSAGYVLPVELEVDRDYEQIIDYAGGRGVGVGVFRPLAGGALTGQAKGVVGRHVLAGGQISRDPAPYQRDLARAAWLADLLRCDGEGLLDLAYRFALDHDSVTTVLGGFSDVSQLDLMVRAAERPLLSEDERYLLQAAWSNNFGLGSAEPLAAAEEGGQRMQLRTYQEESGA